MQSLGVVVGRPDPRHYGASMKNFDTWIMKRGLWAISWVVKFVTQLILCCVWACLGSSRHDMAHGTT